MLIVKIFACATVVLYIFYPFPLIAQGDEFTSWLMPRVITRLNENEKIKRDFITYQKTKVVEDMDFNPPRQKSIEQFEVFGKNGNSYERPTYKNGQRLPNKKPTLSGMDFNRALSGRYVYDAEMPKEQKLDGRWCFVINLRPKDRHQLPWRGYEDEVLNRLRGTLWIDIETLTISKVEMKILTPFEASEKRLRGLLRVPYTVHEFVITIDQELFSEVVVPKKVEIKMHYDSPLWPETNERHIYTYQNRFDSRSQPQQ